MRRQIRTFAHIGNIAALALMKTDQHATLLRYHPRRQPRTETVAPRRAMNRRIKLFSDEVAEMQQVHFQHPLLGRHLPCR